MFYAAILAGGKSSRMGQDKCELVLQGQTLLERASVLLKSAGSELVLISGRVQGQSSVPDLLPHCGPPGGLFSLLDHIRNNYGLDGSPLVLIPVDMPQLSVEAITHLLETSVNATCCHYDGEVFPCVLKTTPDLYMHLRNLFADGTELGGRRSMKAIMNFLGAKVVSMEGRTEGEFRNVNTLEEWLEISAHPPAKLSI